MNKKEKARDSYLKRRFGISIRQYSELLKAQGNVCFICKRPPSTFKRNLAVDHCHKTLRIRGILCPFCNRGLRYFSDNPDRFNNAAAYLVRDTGLFAPALKRRKRRKKTRH